MNWIQPPETVRRFTVHQILQHGFAVGLWVLLLGSAIAAGWGISGVRSLHAVVGIAGGAFIVYHALTLAAIGILLDTPAERIAFLPWGRDWDAIRRRKGSAEEPGKYVSAEKGDYLAILAWSLFAVLSGILLRWPSFFGVPGSGAYDWIRAAHAGFGAALTVHILVVHLPGRWTLASPAFRRAVLSGTVPLSEAEKRRGWIRDLVALGVLVPAPEETVTAEEKESGTVRDLLERGNRLVREGMYTEACGAYEAALRLLPDYSQARFNFAVALFRGGRREEATTQLRIFIEKDPFNPMVEKARGMIEEIEGSAE